MKKWLYSILVLIVVLVGVAVLLFEQNDRFRQGLYKAIISENQIPEDYIPVYHEAADTYSIPWELLAAVHRVETIFSTMEPMESPVGALGHFQFMPRTWIGWTYPGVDDIGNVADDVDITDIGLIEEHNGYGTDATGNGEADPFNLYDSAYAAARFLSEHGAVDGDYEDALFSYNRSDAYVEEVMHYFETYKENYDPIQLYGKQEADKAH
ncbi:MULTISPECIES: lytic transglycosylase domain-containing protein [Shouchella]|uniref:Lytic transglycosylase domain-containing protein n=2 Tax=Shouchella TaxID=2893057 RepID=A0ABY7W4V2_9BACI|nr:MULTISPECIES: lytic transglycosylase domain-containing protein [Shouchella]MED4127153.1 lytic transglycosylase domain-containing protein [Shouchella miscanthi]WDF03636.1 lytic transglycosylase domain-containing protein [Shouchella hunanensis]GAF23390.1 membrane protein [Bacillus sp. JCM 19047]